MKKLKLKVSKNIYGNYRVMVGNKGIFMTGSEFDAQHRLDEMYATGAYELSEHSYLQPTDDKAKNKP